MTSYPKDLPPGLTARRRTPSFTEQSVPAALLKDHSTKAGVWGVLHVEAGRLKYTVPSEGWELEIPQGETAIIRPEVPHYITPFGSVTFYVEFWGEDAV